MLCRKHYPKTLEIGDNTYRIMFVKDFPDKRQIGECDPETKIIKIKKGLTKEETAKTLIHEVCHAIFDFEYDIPVNHRFITRLEQPFYQFLVDNFICRQ